MRLTLTAAAASLAIATAACNTQKADDTAQANIDDTALNADMNMTGTDNMAAAMTGDDFVATVAGSDLYEIESGKLAQSTGASDAVKKFGAMLATDHTKSSALLKTAASEASPAATLPTTMSPEHQANLDALKAAKGAEFDRLFVEQQKAGHQKTLDALKSYAAGGDVPSLKSFATTATPVVEGHLKELNAMKM